MDSLQKFPVVFKWSSQPACPHLSSRAWTPEPCTRSSPPKEEARFGILCAIMCHRCSSGICPKSNTLDNLDVYEGWLYPTVGHDPKTANFLVEDRGIPFLPIPNKIETGFQDGISHICHIFSYIFQVPNFSNLFWVFFQQKKTAMFGQNHDTSAIAALEPLTLGSWGSWPLQRPLGAGSFWIFEANKILADPWPLCGKSGWVKITLIYRILYNYI